MPSTSVHLPSSLLERLDSVAKRRGVSRNRLITEACRSLVDGGRDEWPDNFFAQHRLSATDAQLLRSTFGDWTQDLMSRRSKKAPPF